MKYKRMVDSFWYHFSSWTYYEVSSDIQNSTAEPLELIYVKSVIDLVD